MNKFNVTKVITAENLANFVANLNAQTQDGFIVDQARIGPRLWMIRVACSLRGDADLVRGW